MGLYHPKGTTIFPMTLGSRVICFAFECFFVLLGHKGSQLYAHRVASSGRATVRRCFFPSMRGENGKLHSHTHTHMANNSTRYCNILYMNNMYQYVIYLKIMCACILYYYMFFNI